MAAPKQQLQYVVIPHPDDEFSAWSLVEGATDNYPVFVLLTHGEATEFADGHGLQAALGERPPAPQPFQGQQSLYVRAQRLESWHTFLDRMAGFDATLDTPPFTTHLPGPGTGVDVFVGSSTARVVLDLGDGRLTADAVAAALNLVRTKVKPMLPVQREFGVIGAAYFNAQYAGPTYTHPDHRAVHDALWHTDFGLPGPQWARTAHADPDAAGDHGRTNAITPSTYDKAMALDTGGQRTGALQQVYGWLAFDAGGAFPVGPNDSDDGMWSRVQTFWRRF